ncbi:pseudouridine synthase family protein [Tieghemostelium lacteum]|uniref:Pseudouridine synthase family protein n=1 Tax=Tieghemostelium lacteum TaxID=361077 RepID=A0A152A5R7_TIELA|nr:pseudouridine synthase family protein [Tieghemostelium lacteum]|eukprot:KYR01560.1 pseudouridine synthase family protein [Tieghemostelium lacteum]
MNETDIINENNKRLRSNNEENVDNDDNDIGSSSNTMTTTTTTTTTSEQITKETNTIDIPNEKPIHKKYIQADGTILSKIEYRKKINNEKKKRKIEGAEKKRELQKQEKLKKNDENGGNISREHLAETSYYFDGELRMVVPYYFQFNVNVKERWCGKTLIDLFTEEFSTITRHIYMQKIKRGWIQLNHKIVPHTTIVKLNDVVSHRVHRHEPPVYNNTPIKIVELNDDVVVVDKPSSMPIHPCGRFRHNTLIFILAKEHNLCHLYGFHRLDRLTSGLLMLARTPLAAKHKATELQQGSVQKTYLALVKGKFPVNPDPSSDGFVIIDQPIVVQPMRLGMNYVGENGKPSVTHIKLLNYNQEKDTSVVLCQPKTGRTHQIRIHLKFIGHPIANDPLYNDIYRVKQKHLTSDGTCDLYDEEEDSSSMFGSSNKNNNNSNTTTTTTTTTSSTSDDNFVDDESIPIECLDCKIDWKDPTKINYGIYLHALAYESDKWQYKTEFPKWAIENNPDQPIVFNFSKVPMSTSTTKDNNNNNNDNENKIEN